MVFDSRFFADKPDGLIDDNAFREVDLGIAFRKVLCYRCGFEGVYKYRVQQIRRNREIRMAEGEEVRPDHEDIWKSIPRFAEIPETVKCKNCREVLGIYTFCLY